MQPSTAHGVEKGEPGAGAGPRERGFQLIGRFARCEGRLREAEDPFILAKGRFFLWNMWNLQDSNTATPAELTLPCAGGRNGEIRGSLQLS